jgi:hypothetical protein
MAMFAVAAAVALLFLAFVLIESYPVWRNNFR